ncbi:unnamed protein product [Parnassius apollo]|uniref:(apollo) hypothetical protein n=1 Tax=Parnassius apollo TaxID=110799 RepID=A0A8S3Y0C6_PARAO|nr:unnamed protein product [Parnassius apollo]
MLLGLLERNQLAATDMTLKRFRRRSPCDECLYPPDKKPCFDIKKVTVERGNSCHSNMIRSFLYTHFWPQEPSVVGLWTPLNSPYLEVLTDQYANSGDRFLAFEKIERTGETKLIGVSIGNKVLPWTSDELEEWAHSTSSKPEQTRMYFNAHCLKDSNLINKYNVDYLYEVEILSTDPEVAGQGVGKLLLNTALSHAEELGYPVAQVIAVSHYTSKICKKCGMKLEWSMKYEDFVDRAGRQMFFPRRPHLAVEIYSKFFDPSKNKEEPCKPQYF